MKVRINYYIVEIHDNVLKQLFRKGNIKDFLFKHDRLKTKYILNYSLKVPEPFKTYRYIAYLMSMHNMFLINKSKFNGKYKIQRWCRKIPLSIFILEDN